MRLLRLACFGCLFLLFSPLSQGQEIATKDCLDQVYRALAREQRMYRTVLFGRPSAQSSALGTVLYDRDGNAWMKTESNSWRSTSARFDGTSWSNTLMEQRRESPSRTGIFETKKVSSSELLPSALQAMRAFQCGTRAVCEATIASQQADAEEFVTVQPAGCITYALPAFTFCRQTGNVTYLNIQTSCEQERTALVEREADLLTLVVSYDAASRTLRQFAGLFEDALLDLHLPLIEPLWQAAKVIGEFSRIPCFLSQCND